MRPSAQRKGVVTFSRCLKVSGGHLFLSSEGTAKPIPERGPRTPSPFHDKVEAPTASRSRRSALGTRKARIPAAGVRSSSVAVQKAGIFGLCPTLKPQRQHLRRQAPRVTSFGQDGVHICLGQLPRRSGRRNLEKSCKSTA